MKEKIIKKLAESFEKELNNQVKIDVVKATGIAIEAIIPMELFENDKKTLAEACIEAASLIDPKKCSNTAYAVASFQSNLDKELTPFFDEEPGIKLNN